MSKYNYVCSSEDNNNRIDVVLNQHFPDISRNQIQSIFQDKKVMVNGVPIKKSYKVQTGDSIEFVFEVKENPTLVEQAIPLHIYYEDLDFAILEKPRHMVVHPAPGHSKDTLVNALLYHFHHLGNSQDTLRPGIVHRMDKDTSGILMVTLNDHSHEYYKSLFKTHDIIREYMAIVHGRVGFDEKTIELPIGRSERNRKTFTIDEQGRYAKTTIRTIERFEHYSLVKCSLFTGRTHQIRVHLKAIGHPLVGDEVYGTKKSAIRKEGQYLHACTLGFVDRNGKKQLFHSPLPDYFTSLLKIWRSK